MRGYGNSSPDGLGSVETGGIFPLANQYIAPPSVGDNSSAPDWTPEEILETQKADDTDGNGIFSNHANYNQGEGIFADKWALPGFVARENGLGPSEVIDQQTGTPIQSFFTDMWNRGPVTGQILHRWPLTQGINAPRAELSAERLDFQRGESSRGIWDNPDANTARPVTNSMGHYFTGKPVDSRYAYNRPAMQGMGSMGEFTMPGGDAWKWALTGLVAGAVGAVVWQMVKK